MRKRITSISCLKTPILSSVPPFVYNPIITFADNNDVDDIGYLKSICICLSRKWPESMNEHVSNCVGDFESCQ
jgi:hypothetical protein